MLDADHASGELQQDGEEGCHFCSKEGRKSRLQKFQINLEECVYVCSWEKCISNTSSSSLILKRKASEIPNLRRRRRRKVCHPTAARVSDVPRSKVSLIWPNKESLCWLDASLLLMVTCQSLRNCLCSSNDDMSLKQLCRSFDSAQLKVESISRIVFTSETVSTSNGDCPGGTLLQSHCERTSAFERTSGEIFSELGDSLELLRALEETSAVHSKSELNRGELLSPKPEGSSTVEGGFETLDLSEPLSLLDEARERIWEQLKPQLRCSKGDEDSPVFALPVLLRKNEHLEAHFRSSYHWQFYCSRCHFVDVFRETRVVLSLKTLSKSLSPTLYVSHRQCPHCLSPQERNSLVIHKLPACPMFHFVDGLPSIKSWNQLEFHHRGHDYKVSAIIQYRQDPRHFIAWIKDGQRNLWLQGDDLKQPVVHWSAEEPNFPPSEAHIVMWERQGRCTECFEEQERFQSIVNADEKCLEQLLQRSGNNVIGMEEEKGKITSYLKAYIPKRPKDLSQENANISEEERTHSEILRTESGNRARRRSTDVLPLKERPTRGSSPGNQGKKPGKPFRRRGNSLALKFAAFSESLQTFVEFKEMMEERRLKNCTPSAPSPRLTRLGSVSPLCSPSGSSESSSLPDNNLNIFPDLDLILEDFKETQDGQMTELTEIELLLQEFR